MAKQRPHGIVMKALHWAYASSLDGVKGVASAEELAREHLAKKGTLRQQVDGMIRRQTTKAAITGFVSSMGGIAVPLSLPASFAIVLFIQVRMVVAIAHMGGFDVRDDRVRALVYACVAGEKPEEMLAKLGVVLGGRMTAAAVSKVSRSVLAAINRRVRARLVPSFGRRRLGRALPIIGGIITARVEGKATARIGAVARDTFVARVPKDELPARPVRRKRPKRSRARAGA
jgi:uncharacterized protein (DUF697 family)